MGTATPQADKILVVGDWLVDEHWLLGEQRSRFSRRRGLGHMLALNPPSASVRMLGGAGLAASILGQMKVLDAAGERSFDIHGVGRWHRRDNSAIRHLLNTAQHQQQTHHRMSFPGKTETGSELPNVILHNLLPSIPAKSDKSDFGTEDIDGATTRIIRLFHRAGPRLELTQRIDWELPPKRHRMDLVTDAISQLPSDIRHVAVVNLDKGVASTLIVSEIAKRMPRADWYVFSKSFQPSWLMENDEVCAKVRLLFVPSTAAKAAMRADAQWTSSSWITDKNIPSADAIRCLQAITTRHPGANIVVAPLGMSILTSDPELTSRSDACVHVQSDPSPCEYGELIPMATVLFPVIAGHLVVQKEDGGSNFAETVRNSLSFTDHWMRSEAERFRDEKFRPTSQQLCRLQLDSLGWTTQHCTDNGTCEKVGSFRELVPYSACEVEAEWEQAFSGRGIIARAPHGVFQLWRAMTDIANYVACVPHKRHILQELVAITSEFRSHSHRHHRSVYLKDAPGSGKSFLVEKLAAHVNVDRVEFNITQMQSRSDLLHCFDTIVTRQAQSPTSALLVFFDEINAHLEGRPVYDSFLAPLEQGIYVRSGNKFHIPPCLWVFAGTDFPTEGHENDRNRSQKASDFVSRLSREPFDLSQSEGSDAERLQELSRLERIYVAIATLCATFPDVTEVAASVFEVLEDLKDDMGPRAIRHFIQNFRDVQRGQVTIENLPDRWWEKTTLRKAKAQQFAARHSSGVPKFVKIEALNSQS